LIGALLALFPRVRVPSWVGAIALATSLALMLTTSDSAAFLYRGGMLAHGVLVAAIISAVVTHPTARTARVLGTQPLRTLGRVSYGVYLWHWPVWVLMTTERTGLVGWRLDAVRLITIAAATTTSYVLIEQPVRKWRAPARTVLTASTAALTAAFIVAAAMIPRVAEPETVYVTAPGSLADVARQRTPPPPPSPARARTAKLAAAKLRPPKKFGVVGDSVASTVAYGLNAIAPQHQISVASAAMIGCGVASGLALDKNGVPYPWAADCEKAVPNLVNGLVVRDDPDVVVWLSTWELADRQVAGRNLRFGTSEHDRALRRAIDEQVRRLTVRRARIVFLAPAPLVDGKLPGVDAEYSRYIHYRALLTEYAASRAPQAVVVDLMPMVCPGGPPCRRIVDGVELRPDGAHFSKETAPLVAERLLPRILDALRQPPPIDKLPSDHRATALAARH
jgi:hypothetical protein